MLLVAQVRDLLNLLGGELERRQLRQVALESFLVGARRDGHDALVKDPAQSNLALRHGVLLS